MWWYNIKVENINKAQKQKPTFYKIMGIVADIIMYPILIISLLASFSMLLFNRNSSLPSFFGTSVVKIISDSMVEDGFQVGDVVFVKKPNYKELKVGDIVAFYNYLDPVDVVCRANLIDKEQWDGTTTGSSPEGRTTAAELKKSKRAVYFHKIKSIKVSTIDGSVYYETVGATEGDTPDGFMREDLVIGQYSNTPNFVRKFCKFCASSWGMIILVVLPLSILILFQCLSIIEQVNNMILENKVFMREEAYDSPESIKAKIMIEMEPFRKAYFYATSQAEEKEKVFAHMWEFEPKNKREEKLIEIAKSSLKFSDDNEKYFNFWINNLSSFQKKKLVKLKEEYDYENLLKSKIEEKRKKLEKVERN